MLTPGSGWPSRVITNPRSTATRLGSMAPRATPVWRGALPVYRNFDDVSRSVATLRSTGGATVAGSGGKFPPTVTVDGVPVLPAASSAARITLSPLWAGSVAVKPPAAVAPTVTVCPVRALARRTRAFASTLPGAPVTVTWPPVTGPTLTSSGLTKAGGTVSMVNCDVASATLPTWSWSVAARRWGPSARVARNVALVAVTAKSAVASASSSWTRKLPRSTRDASSLYVIVNRSAAVFRSAPSGGSRRRSGGRVSTRLALIVTVAGSLSSCPSLTTSWAT